MSTVLIIGAIFTVVMVVPAVLWFTKLIRPATPKEEAIHRGIKEIRQREARRRERMPYYRG